MQGSVHLLIVGCLAILLGLWILVRNITVAAKEKKDTFDILSHLLFHSNIPQNLQTAGLACELLRRSSKEITGIEQSIEVIEECLGNAAKYNRYQDEAVFGVFDTPRKRECDVNDVIDDTIERLKDEIDYRDSDLNKAVINWSKPIEPMYVRTRPGILETSFTAVLRNAIKYSADNDMPVVSVSSSKDGRHVVVDIEDNGPGLEDGVKKRYGKKRISKNRHENSGTGTGIHTANKLVSRNGGRIRIIETGKNGTRIRILLRSV